MIDSMNHVINSRDHKLESSHCIIIIIIIIIIIVI